MFCDNCGKQIPDDSVFCEFCGTKVWHEEESKPIQKQPASAPAAEAPVAAAAPAPAPAPVQAAAADSGEKTVFLYGEQSGTAPGARSGQGTQVVQPPVPGGVTPTPPYPVPPYPGNHGGTQTASANNGSKEKVITGILSAVVVVLAAGVGYELFQLIRTFFPM